jgi:hypothetical protein
MPPAVAGACWDVVLVDSPMGWKYGEGQPGRFQPVYWAVNMARRCIAAGTKSQASGREGSRRGREVPACAWPARRAGCSAADDDRGGRRPAPQKPGRLRPPR